MKRPFKPEDKRPRVHKEAPFNTPFANLGFKIRDGKLGLYTECLTHRILDCKLCKQHPPKEEKQSHEFLSAQERDGQNSGGPQK